MDSSINIYIYIKDHKPKYPKQMRKKKGGKKWEYKKWIKAKRWKRQKVNCVSVRVCMSDTNCMRYFYFHYIVICVNCDMCRCVHVLYKYNLTLYNLIIMK